MLVRIFVLFGAPEEVCEVDSGREVVEIVVGRVDVALLDCVTRISDQIN